MVKAWTNDQLVEMLYNKGDLALACIYQTYNSDLSDYFKKKYSYLEEGVINDVITNSLIALTDNPKKYKKEKASLKTFIIRDINGDIKNHLKKSNNKKKHGKVVELASETENNKEEYTFEYKELEKQIRKFFQDVFKNELDCHLAWMIEIEKEKKTEDYVSLLQIFHLTSPRQQKEVKKHKDRILIKLKRNGWQEFLKTLR